MNSDVAGRPASSRHGLRTTRASLGRQLMITAKDARIWAGLIRQDHLHSRRSDKAGQERPQKFYASRKVKDVGRVSRFGPGNGKIFDPGSLQ